MRGLIVAVAVVGTWGPALAGPNCTSEPKDRWLSEGEMKAKVAELGYVIKVFKTTKGNCYEVYGLDEAGKRIEVYFHPVTGSVVEEHRT